MHDTWVQMADAVRDLDLHFDMLAVEREDNEQAVRSLDITHFPTVRLYKPTSDGERTTFVEFKQDQDGRNLNFTEFAKFLIANGVSEAADMVDGGVEALGMNLNDAKPEAKAVLKKTQRQTQDKMLQQSMVSALTQTASKSLKTAKNKEPEISLADLVMIHSGSRHHHKRRSARRHSHRH